VARSTYIIQGVMEWDFRVLTR